MKSLKKIHQGFTLIEIMTTLLIAGVLIATGVPNFNTMIKNNRLSVATNETIGAFNFARTEAFRRGEPIHIGRGGGAVSWVVWLDANINNTWDAGEELRLWSALPDDVSVSTVREFVSFNSAGLANTTETVTVCDDRNGEFGSQVDLLLSGSVTAVKIGCG